MKNDTITVADMRKDLGDILNRAFYKDEVVEIAKREKPFALVVSYNRKPAVVGIEQLADDIDMGSNDLVALLQAVPKDELRALLKKEAAH